MAFTLGIDFGFGTNSVRALLVADSMVSIKRDLLSASVPLQTELENRELSVS